MDQSGVEIATVWFTWIQIGQEKSTAGPSDVQVKLTEETAKGHLNLCLRKDQPEVGGCRI